MSIKRFDAQQEAYFTIALRRSVGGFDSNEDSDLRLLDDARARHPGLWPGERAPNRWLNVIILRGVQLMVATQGFDALMLGGSEEPFLIMHRDKEILAVQTIPPDTQLLFATCLAEQDCQGILNSVSAATASVLRIVTRVGKETPSAGDVYAERVWQTCRVTGSSPRRGEHVDPRRVSEIVKLSLGRPWLQKFEMALALSERVLVGKDKPLDRQIFAAAAHLMWNDLGTIDWTTINVHAASHGGNARVASLGSQADEERQEFLDLVAASMPLIAADAPVDINVVNGATVKVYRFQGGKRTLIDRLGGRRGRVH